MFTPLQFVLLLACPGAHPARACQLRSRWRKPILFRGDTRAQTAGFRRRRQISRGLPAKTACLLQQFLQFTRGPFCLGYQFCHQGNLGVQLSLEVADQLMHPDLPSGKLLGGNARENEGSSSSSLYRHLP
jgi:hypothetical protein